MGRRSSQPGLCGGIAAAAVAAVICGLAGCGAGEAGAAPLTPGARAAAWRAARERAHAWLDGLRVDAVELTRSGVKGRKKLAEILEAYAWLLRSERDPARRTAIELRVEALAEQTRRPEYHGLDTASLEELTRESMSYMRVLALLEELGVAHEGYVRELRDARERIDGHLPVRGPWQRAMFRHYYERFGLELPPILADATGNAGILDERRAAGEIGRLDAYRLAHQVFVAFDYGRRRSQDRLTAGDLAYLAQVLPALAERAIEEPDHDLLGEIVSCMTYLDLCHDPAWQRGVDVLLQAQNPDGSWGRHEHRRAEVGDLVAQKHYLHTTQVVLRALIEAREASER